MDRVVERLEIPKGAEDSDELRPLFPVERFADLKEWLYSHDSSKLSPQQLENDLQYVASLAERLEGIEDEFEERADEYSRVATEEELEEFKLHLPWIRWSTGGVRGSILLQKHSSKG